MSERALPAHMDDVVARLVDVLDPEQIILFGSWAWGEPNEHSDVDVMVVVSERGDSAAAMATRAYRALGLIRAPVEIVVRTKAEVDCFGQVAASLEHRVITQGRLLYERGEAPLRARLAHQGSR